MIPSTYELNDWIRWAIYFIAGCFLLIQIRSTIENVVRKKIEFHEFREHTDQEEGDDSV